MLPPREAAAFPEFPDAPDEAADEDPLLDDPLVTPEVDPVEMMDSSCFAISFTVLVGV